MRKSGGEGLGWGALGIKGAVEESSSEGEKRGETKQGNGQGYSLAAKPHRSGSEQTVQW